MLWSANHCSCPCHHHNLPCMSIYFHFCNNNNSTNTNDHSGFHTFTILRVIWSLERFYFDFTMDTVLLIFKLINGPLIFISCICTIVNSFITLYFWCQHHFSKSYNVSMAMQVSQLLWSINIEVSCHLKVINEVSFYCSWLFTFPISMVTYQQWLWVFPKCNLIFLNNFMFTLKACSTVNCLADKHLKLSQVCLLTFLGKFTNIEGNLL